MKIKTLHDLFLHELADMHNAETQLTNALTEMAEKASDSKLADGFRTHLDETKGQIERINDIVQICDLDLPKFTCDAMKGLVKESNKLISEIEDDDVRDAAMITAAQKIEHYEIASYGSLCALAECLDYPQKVIDLLNETLKEEKATDEKLTQLAEQGGINKDALKTAA